MVAAKKTKWSKFTNWRRIRSTRSDRDAHRVEAVHMVPCTAPQSLNIPQLSNVHEGITSRKALGIYTLSHLHYTSLLLDVRTPTAVPWSEKKKKKFDMYGSITNSLVCSIYFPKKQVCLSHVQALGFINPSRMRRERGRLCWSEDNFCSLNPRKVQ